MIQNYKPAAFLFVVLGLCFYHTPTYGITTESDVPVEELEQWVETWSKSLKSFDGRYTYTVHRYFDDEAPFSQHDIRYKSQDDNLWFTTDGLFGEGTKHTEAIFNGKCSYRLDRTIETDPPIDGEMVINRDGGWRWPMHFMSLDFLYTRPYALTRLDEILTHGHNYAVVRDGQYVLSHWANDDIDSSVEIYFYPDRTVSKMEWGPKFGLETPHQTEDHLPSLVAEVGSAFDIRIPGTTIEYLNYVDFDDTRFPVEVRETDYSIYDLPSNAEAKQQAGTGEIEWHEYFLRIFRDKEKIPIVTERTMELNVAETTFNALLPDEAFKIDFGANAMVYDTQTTDLYRVPAWWEFVLTPLFWGLTIPFLVIAGAGIWYWRENRLPA